MARKKPAPAVPLTTAQRLGSLLKSARDIMRKDKGLNGDLDRLPLLTWVMFLKFLDDAEGQRQQKAALAGKKCRPAVEPPYRWRDWAAREDGVTGPELLAFVSYEKATRPDGTEGPGLLHYLRNLDWADEQDPRRTIANVFAGVGNRMESGYLLREVVNKVNGIHFSSTDEIHTLGHLYESMLKEMRDAAGDSGEFYTPRPVVRFMVAATDPRLGETVLDPACGTGGFLVETYSHLEKQVKTVQDRQKLQTATVYGGEAKPLPYMLAQMNLLLHGLEAPNLTRGNSLDVKLGEIGDRDRVDVILTKPPFGGEEERGILGNFPEDKRTAETALLFLQLIMRKLRRLKPAATTGTTITTGTTGTSVAAGFSLRWGRAAVVVPNDTLFGDGVCARIKEELLTQFNLHTVVHLPNGVFAPYTSIPTNLLLFERGGPTKEVWYYELPPPEGRKQYTKTQPLTFEEFADCLKWWNKRRENERAWKVPAVELLATGCNLDRKNPRGKPDIEHLPPAELVESILQKQARVAAIVGEINGLLAGGVAKGEPWPRVPLGKVMAHRKEFVQIDDLQSYKRCRVQLHAQGVVLRDVVLGAEIKTKKQQECRPGEFLVAEIDAKVGGFGIVPDDLAGAIVSSHYFLFVVNEQVLDLRFLDLYIRTLAFREQVSAQGSTNYAAIRPADLLKYLIPLPPLEKQVWFGQLQAKVDAVRKLPRETAAELDALLPAVLAQAFAGRL